MFVLVSFKYEYKKENVCEIKIVANSNQTGSINNKLKFTIAKRPFHHSSSDISNENVLWIIYETGKMFNNSL